MKRAVICAVLCLGLISTVTRAQAQCRLALVLALDVSASVDTAEYELQRLGLAAALDAPEIRHAILGGGPGYVALAVYEWSGFYQQKLHLDWTALRSGRDIDLASLALGTMKRSRDDFPTAVGQALAYGATLLDRAPDCTRKVIDISGDGINNFGFGPDAAYRNFPFDGVTVNGLVIIDQGSEVQAYYRDLVIRGQGSFVETANGFSDFREAMTRKLFREINDIVLGTLPQPPVDGRG